MMELNSYVVRGIHVRYSWTIMAWVTSEGEILETTVIRSSRNS